MNTSAAINVGPSSVHAANPAVLVLDAAGRVELASPAACALWQAHATELVGDYFPNLFALDCTSRDADWIQTQWEVLQAAALDQELALKLQPKEAAAYNVGVRLEQTGADPAAYLAWVNRVSPAGPEEVGGSLFHALTERSGLGFFDLNFVRNEVYYSPAWKRMLGYTDAGLPSTYETWLALIHPDDSAAAPDKMAARGTTTGSRPFSVEYRLKHANGHYVWVQGVGVQVHGPNGALQRVVGTHLDIQDRKEFEENSLRAEERLHLLGERGRVAIFDVDFTGNCTWLSAAYKALLGYGETELPDEPDSVLRALPPDETTGGLAAYFLAPDPGQAVFFAPLRVRHRNGSDLWVYAGVVRVFSRKHELQRVLGFVSPMPEGLAAGGSDLPASQLASLLGEISEGVLLVDGQGRVIYLNATAERLLGRTASQTAGRTAADVFRLVNRLTGGPGESPIDRALTLGEASPLNNEFFFDAGPETPPMPVTFSCRPMRDAGGQAAGAVLVFRNPEEMSLTREELIRANRFDYLGQLAGGIAHDFNNLLTIILGGVSVAKENHEYAGLENSERACEAAKQLTKQLLSFAKGSVSVRQVLKPGELLADARRLSTAGSAVKVEVTVPADLGTVCADKAQLLQVFQNLIINAIQAMPAGQGNVWVTAGDVTLADGQIPSLAAGQYVAIEVRDNGAGIKPEHLQKVFDPFFTTKKTGTGLGLATVVSIILRHGGQVTIDSELGVGSTFTVILPRAEQEAVVEARRVPSLPIAKQTGRVLFMDDDQQISYLTGTMLESLGYKYDLAATGEEAIQLYKRYLNIGRPYDIVIMDLTIVGGMGGEQAFRVLRDLDPDVRAIIASGYDNDDMARQFLDMGFCGYLTKPYRIGDLGRIIKKVIGN